MHKIVVAIVLSQKRKTFAIKFYFRISQWYVKRLCTVVLEHKKCALLERYLKTHSAYCRK